MDPYLEDGALWPSFHHHLIFSFHHALRSTLAARYGAAVGQRRYAAGPDGGEEHCEEFVAVREKNGGKLVTVLEVVSPANKTTEAGRKAYLATRREARAAGANLVELDLVLQGQPTLDYPRDRLPPRDYTITVLRAAQDAHYEIYTATLQNRLPRFRLPLAADDRDTVFDLHSAFTPCYDQGGFGGKIDYLRDPPVPLSGENAAWLDNTLTAAGVRAPTPSAEHVAVAAYHIWEREGRPLGREREHWETALAELRHRQEPVTV
jgi:hypothetical protein